MYVLDKIAAALAANVAVLASDASPKGPAGLQPIPRPPKLCGDGGPFVNNATSSSPLVGDCLKLTEHHELMTPFTYNITKDVRFTNLAYYKSCMSGIRSTVGDAEFNREDGYALFLAVTKGMKNDDRIEGTTKVNCDGVEVEWSLYSPRDSVWL